MSRSLLRENKIQITDKLSIVIPTVGEILDDEQKYYSTINSLTATPWQYMVQLDDMGIDFTQISEYDLFFILFPAFAQEGMPLVFGDIDLSDIEVMEDATTGSPVLYSAKSDVIINEAVYLILAEKLRSINNLEKETRKPGNEIARKKMIELERKKQKRNANKPYDPYLEKLVIAMVNCPEFKYNYEGAFDMSIYTFNQSFKQVQTRITFDNTMVGVYAGTVDTSKMSDKSSLSWLQIK